MAAAGSFKNPSEKDCWKYCFSCGRCENKTRYTKCNGCSGRYDPTGVIEQHAEDYCDCRNGVLRWRTQQGRIIITKFKSNPYAGSVTYEKKSEDERDWDSYVNDMREKMNDPNWNPITITGED
jgi:hypothetical protein